MIGRIEAQSSLSVAEKMRTWLRQLFEYAVVVVPDMENSPARDLHVVAIPLPPVRHNPFLIVKEPPSFLRDLRAYQGRKVTQMAVRLLLLTGVRTGGCGWPRLTSSTWHVACGSYLRSRSSNATC
ncbi:hypothetical protein [Achromobacter animicus]|uniref:hypothetical protein n=1 Tax=Achromobacter animicus TaxID=1389935 RepID=UPI003C7D8CEC